MAIPQMQANINKETLYGGSWASTQSFSTTPCLFWIWWKNNGRADKITATINEPDKILYRV